MLPKFEIKNVSVGGHSRPAPIGLSDLVNRAGLWKNVAPSFSVSNYSRDVSVGENGNLVTTLKFSKKDAIAK